MEKFILQIARIIASNDAKKINTELNKFRCLCKAGEAYIINGTDCVRMIRNFSETELQEGVFADNTRVRSNNNVVIIKDNNIDLTGYQS